MPATNKSIKASQKPYKPRKDRNEAEKSIINMIYNILKMKNVRQKEKKIMIKILLCRLTETKSGKFSCRYRTKLVFSDEEYKIQHEHVYRREITYKELVNNPENYKEILNKCIGCVVTKEEHKLLNKIDKKYKNINGWERYKKAGIKVLDMKTNQPLIFD